MGKPTSEAYAAPLLSRTQRALFDELRTSCETAAINGASLGDMRAATELLNEHMICACEAAANEEAVDTLGIRLADDDDDGGDGPDRDGEGWKSLRD